MTSQDPMIERFDRAGLISVAGAFLLILSIAAAGLNMRTSEHDDAEIKAATRMSARAEAVLSAMKDLETGERGFLLTGQERFLQPYYGGLQSLDAELPAGLPAAEDLPQLREFVQTKKNVAAEAIAERRTGGLEAGLAHVVSGEDKAAMDAVRARVAEIREKLDARAEEISDHQHRRDAAVTTVSSLVSLAACAWFAWLAITRRKRERETDALLQAVLENAPVGLGFFDGDLRVRHANKTLLKMAGDGSSSGRAVRGRPASDVLGQAGVALHEQLSSVISQRWSIPDIEIELADEMHAEDQPRYLLASLYPLRPTLKMSTRWRSLFNRQAVLTAAERPGVGLVITDITDRKRSEVAIEAARDAAEAANQAKSAFIANMSHELRTPLSAIIGYSEMLQEEIGDSKDSAVAGLGLGEDVAKIESNARHLLGLINDVLDLSKVESGKMEVFAESFEVAGAVEEVAGTVQSLVMKKNNRIEVKASPSLGEMNTDLVKLRQILFNLLSNAAKFTENGLITLEVLAEATPGEAIGRWIVFKVSDTGIGMTQEQLGRLFQRFQQADASTTRKFGGTGLGLSLVKVFSTMLGGSVGVESQAGVGTTFTVRLPADIPLELLAPAVADTAPIAAPETQQADGHPRDPVLIIDDDPAQQDLMSRFLRREGFDPHIAVDGESGLKLAASLRPRAILLDVMMPGMDGWTVLERLKADPALAPIPVVMVTFAGQRSLASALGAADYVPKPVVWEEFRHVMDRFRRSDGEVLVVDDDVDARHRLRTVLEREGWSVAEAGNGLEALQRVEHVVPQLILLDLTMPVMDGFSFLSELRNRPDCAHVPVVVLTARDLSRADRERLDSARKVLRKDEVSLGSLAADLHALAPGKAED
jgi:signal transduction histidine kinase/DNA-binding response OmpR family regulator/CHASE3 domain sensor protein